MSSISTPTAATRGDLPPPPTTPQNGTTTEEEQKKVSPPSSNSSSRGSGNSTPNSVMKETFPSPGGTPKVLLLEGVHNVAVQILRDTGLNVESVSKALPAEELKKRLGDVTYLGIRSKTNITKDILSAAPLLRGIGCFCIGTNQVDLEAATDKAVAVFNSPFANTRSVAELTMGEVISLARKLPLRSAEVHAGGWNKSSNGCHEVRGKTLGIVGYGHIGSQVGVLAEAFGMRVIFYNHSPKLALGNCVSANSLQEVLEMSHFVTMHVPETPKTMGMIGEAELASMRKGACLINNSRGTVVDLDALAASLTSGHLAGAAVDVFPVEPEGAGEKHQTPLQGVDNVILTPHVGGSTVEAQHNIGQEVAHALLRFMSQGSTMGCVNLPQVNPPEAMNHRITNLHQNVPGALRDINLAVADTNCNVTGQMLATKGRIGYLTMDTDHELSVELRQKIADLPTSLRTILIKS